MNTIAWLLCSDTRFAEFVENVLMVVLGEDATTWFYDTLNNWYR